MTTLTCPKCRQGLADDALDAGQCHLCGFPFDGPVILGVPDARSTGTRRLLALFAAILVVAGVGGYVFFGRSTGPHAPSAELAALSSSVPERPANHMAPFPHEPKPRTFGPETSSPPAANSGSGNDASQPQVPAAVELPKKDGPRPVGVRMKVDPKIEPKRHFDHPDDTAQVPDLSRGERVTLTGRVRVLRLGSVSGKSTLDASALVAEEVIISGDVNGEALVLVKAPNGTVTVGGYVMGNAKLTIVSPGGVVTVANSGRIAGSASITAITKRLEVNGPLSGNARVNVTLTTGGSLKLARAEEGAMVTYKKALASDPAPVIEKGELHGGTKVIAGD